MGSFIDLSGRKFGRLTVLLREGSDRFGQARWKCLCVCGCTVVVAGGKLRRGHTTSCGCYQRERSAEVNEVHSHSKWRTLGRTGYLARP